MKNLAVFSLIVFISIGVYSQNERIQEIDHFISSWHNAAAENNQDIYFNMIDENGIYIGTDSTEIWTKQEFYDWSTPHFEKGKTWNFTANSRNIYTSDDGQMAWFDELVDYGKGTLRGSGILIKRHDGWKILHYVLSLPVPNEKFMEVMEVVNTVPEEIEREE
ncbi:MAG: nuclear transport factor 2 family protein [Bacteroidales bacterium]|nr:nuclear transport factor 2 family protein [Bacteroidales bacterium]